MYIRTGTNTPKKKDICAETVAISKGNSRYEKLMKKRVCNNSKEEIVPEEEKTEQKKLNTVERNY